MAHGTPMRSRFLTIPSFLALSLLSMAFSGPSLAQRCPRRLYLGPALFRFVTSGTPSALAPGSRHTRTLPRTPAPSSRPTHSTIATRTIHARHSGHRAAQRRWPPIPTIGAANGTGLPNPQTKRPEGGSRAERLEQCTRRPPSSPFPRLWRARSRNMAGMAPASQQKQSTASRARRTADARVHRLHSARKDSRVASVFHATGSSMHQHRGGPTLAVRKKWAYVVGASTVRLPSDRRRQPTRPGSLHAAHRLAAVNGLARLDQRARVAHAKKRVARPQLAAHPGHVCDLWKRPRCLPASCWEAADDRPPARSGRLTSTAVILHENGQERPR